MGSFGLRGPPPWRYHLLQSRSSPVGELTCRYRPFLWQVPGMGPYTNPEKYEGEGLFHHRTLFRV